MDKFPGEEDEQIAEIKKLLKPAAYTEEETAAYNKKKQETGLSNWAPILGIGATLVALYHHEMLSYLFSYYGWFLEHPDKIIPFFEHYWEHGTKFFPKRS